ncbi:MAG: hypothetical protein M5U34_04060 [Chloroflexi bacterium]|nr:hypothetical protein [Chloroflexota bacterium]
MSENKEKIILIIAGIVIAIILICGLGSLFFAVFGFTSMVGVSTATTVVPLPPPTATSATLSTGTSATLSTGVSTALSTDIIPTATIIPTMPPTTATALPLATPSTRRPMNPR